MQSTPQNIALQGLCDSFLTGAVPALNAAAKTLLPNIPIATTVPSSYSTPISSSLVASGVAPGPSFSSFPSLSSSAPVPSSSFPLSSTPQQQSSTHQLSSTPPGGHSGVIPITTTNADGSTITTTSTSISKSAPTRSQPSSAPKPGAGSLATAALSETSRNIAIGVGIGLGIPLLVITPLTVFHRRQRVGRDIWTGRHRSIHVTDN